ncbi:MAG: hypothetical protein J6S76_03695, partial [Clostridia bacterium]|nr:hypothetical protein [Clostridia bacterium]
QEAPENTDIPDTTAAQGEASPAASDPFANWFFTDAEETDAPAQKPSAEAVRSVGAPTGTVDAVPMPQPVHTSAQSHPPVREADMSRTRVISMPTSEQIPVHPRPRPAQAPHSDGSRSTEQYRQEQSAIWGASSVTDPSRRPNRQSPTGYQTGRTPSKKTRDLQQAASRTPNKREKKEYEDYGNVTWLQSKTYWGEGSAEGVRRFRLIFWISLPFVIALLLAYAAVAIGLIAGMALLVACAVAALVAWVAVGALVALIGIIYGVSQIFLVMPIGLFELGIGVATIGVTMLVGILLYNFAVRLLPYLIRKFIALQGTLKLFLVDLYYYVKGECYRR